MQRKLDHYDTRTPLSSNDMVSGLIFLSNILGDFQVNVGYFGNGGREKKHRA